MYSTRVLNFHVLTCVDVRATQSSQQKVDSDSAFLVGDSMMPLRV